MVCSKCQQKHDNLPQRGYNKKVNDIKFTKNLPNNYFICGKTGVLRIQNGEIYRKFRKYCYFVLCFRGKNGIM